MNAATDAGDKQRHTFLPQVEDCTECHSDTTGNGNFHELGTVISSNYQDINALIGELYAAILDYGMNGLPQASPVYYDSAAYPYWFKDNGMGSSYGNRYTDFDFDMLTAAYNYQVALKDPAGYIHNGSYIQQLLFDSICLMGGTPGPSVPGRTTCP
jgi:hypothetical protein